MQSIEHANIRTIVQTNLRGKNTQRRSIYYSSADCCANLQSHADTNRRTNKESHKTRCETYSTTLSHPFNDSYLHSIGATNTRADISTHCCAISSIPITHYATQPVFLRLLHNELQHWRLFAYCISYHEA